MKLYKLRIQNFRKLKDVEIPFSDATFLIGANNAGKTTTLDAIERLLEIKSAFAKEDLSKYYDANTEGEIDEEGDIIVEGEVRDVSPAILNERGFKKERLFTYEENGVTKYGFFYRVKEDLLSVVQLKYVCFMIISSDSILRRYEKEKK